MALEEIVNAGINPKKAEPKKEVKPKKEIKPKNGK